MWCHQTSGAFDAECGSAALARPPPPGKKRYWCHERDRIRSACGERRHRSEARRSWISWIQRIDPGADEIEDAAARGTGRRRRGRDARRGPRHRPHAWRGRRGRLPLDHFGATEANWRDGAKKEGSKAEKQQGRNSTFEPSYLALQPSCPSALNSCPSAFLPSCLPVFLSCHDHRSIAAARVSAAARRATCSSSRLRSPASIASVTPGSTSAA